MTLHWHEQNPWKDRVVYVPIELLAACVAGGMVMDVDKVSKPHDAAFILNHWRQCGRDKLDAYILPQPGFKPSLGVRYGAEGSEYYSPHNANPSMTKALLALVTDKIERLQANLNGRDQFIVEHDLWTKFTDTLPR